ncbi:MAG: cytidylate kinase-like family protein [Synergistaceae bacterium]|jgi:cytidylate kinase|nr:cytidylate kinase-like family protein [Synergistaceae bacterium]
MNSFIVTIAREYGSGGRLIGQKLASDLGVSFYDKEIIALASKECGLHEDFIRTIEQKKASGFFYNLFMHSQELPIPEQVFLAQSNVIKSLAEKGSCVIIGRCADYVLADMKNCIRVFVYAPIETRIKNVRDEYHEGEGDLEDYIRRQDKGRASYYNFFTDQKWGRAQNYDLCVNSCIGIDASVRIIKNYIGEFTGGGDLSN